MNTEYFFRTSAKIRTVGASWGGCSLLHKRDSFSSSARPDSGMSTGFLRRETVHPCYLEVLRLSLAALFDARVLDDGKPR